MRPIDQSERWLIVGTTGSGKTSAAKWLLLHYDPPIIALDSKRSGYPSLQPHSVKETIDLLNRRWRSIPKIIRVTPSKSEDDYVEGIYDAALARGDVTIVEDEALLVPQSAGRKFAFVTGRSENVGIISCTQRPFGVIREAISESERKWEFTLHDRKDKQRIAEFSAIPADVRLDKHRSVYYDSSDGEVVYYDPIPDLDYDKLIAHKFRGRHKNGD